MVSSCTASPLPLHVNPIAWRRASALSLYPLPDLIVLAGDFAPPFAATPPTVSAVAAASPAGTLGADQRTRTFSKEYPIVLSPVCNLISVTSSTKNGLYCTFLGLTLNDCYIIIFWINYLFLALIGLFFAAELRVQSVLSFESWSFRLQYSLIFFWFRI